MFDKSFYPTSINTIIDMLSGIKIGNKNSILEPSAGKGDILDYLKDKYHSRINLYAIEKNPELQLILKGKGYKVLTDDFLTFDPANQFDLIIMNPPFEDGVKHLLKAWEIIQNGEIVCLLNSETLNNPFSKERQLLKEIINQYGSTKNLGSCFANSERSTNIDTIKVYLKKETKSSYKFDFDQDKEDKVDIEFDQENPLAKMDVLENTVILYKEALEAYKGYRKARSKMQYYGLQIGNIGDALAAEFNAQDRTNAFVDTFKKSCWDRLFNMTDFSRVVTEKVYKEFQEFQGSQGMMDFTVNNIKNLFDTLLMSRGDIMEGCLVEVFDEFTKYHEDNRVYIEGWKTNKFWKVTKKVILPYTIGRTWSGNFEIDYRRGRFLDDIDKAMCYISGKKWDEVDCKSSREGYTGSCIYTGTGIRASLLRYFQDLKVTSGTNWNLLDSEFFTMRFYKKGTLHIVFKDEYIWSEFNLRATKSKNWLGNEK